MFSSVAIRLLLLTLDSGQLISQAGLSLPIVFVTAAALFSALIMRHSPHDVIEAIGIGYGPSREKTVFVISRHNLLRSSQDATWKRLTHGLGPFKLSSLVVSPSFATDQTVFVASFGGGVYRSLDGGTHWSPCNHGMADRHIVLLLISPRFQNDNRLFALGRSGAVYRSDNGGEYWEICSAIDGQDFSKPAIEKFIALDDDTDLLDPIRDAGEAWVKCHRKTGMTCLGFATDGIVAGTDQGKLYTSINGGASWEFFASLPGDSVITCVEIPEHAGIEDSFFVGTRTHGVYRISQAGKIIETTRQSGQLAHVTALSSYSDANSPLTLLACSWQEAMFISVDKGVSWQQQSAGLTKHRQADEQRFGAPHFNALAVYQGLHHTEAYVGGFDGLFQSKDFEHWTSIETLPFGIVTSVAVSPALDNMFSIAVSNYGAGVSMMADAAKADAKAWQICNNGLSTIRLGAIAFSPEFRNDQTLLVACESHVLKSIDAGKYWQKTALRPRATKRGISVRLFSQIRLVERWLTRYLSSATLKQLKALFQAVTLRFGGRVSHFIFPSVFAFSPDFRNTQTVFIGTRAHGIFRSEDAGDSFTQVWEGTVGYVFSLVVSPGYISDRTVFATASDGLYCSKDGGLTWQSENLEKPFHFARLAISPAFATDGTLFAGGPAGLFRSSDRGRSWHAITVEPNQPGMAISGLALSPFFQDDSSLLVYGCGQGLYLSDDRGEHFNRLPWQGHSQDHAFSQMQCFPDTSTLFQFSPNYSQDSTLVAVSMDQVYRSNDSGLTWTHLPKPTRHEDSRPEIDFQGRWSVDFNDAFSCQRARRSSAPFSSATLTFVGSEITWIGSTGPDHGKALIYVDSELRSTIDLYSPDHQHAVALYSIVLPQGLHTFSIQVHEQHNPLSSGRTVVVDALDVMQGGLVY